jgi:hypothetical protein
MNETDQSKKQNSTYAAISSFNRSELCRRFNISSARSIFGVNPFFYKSVFQKQKKICSTQKPYQANFLTWCFVLQAEQTFGTILRFQQKKRHNFKPVVEACCLRFLE